MPDQVASSTHSTQVEGAAAPQPKPVPVHPLRERNFRLLFTGSTISQLGDQFYFVAFPWLILQQTGSAIAMGAIMMMGAVPRAVLMLMGGAVSDSISPRKIMMITAGARAMLVAMIGLFVWFRVLRTWELYALAAAFGTADAFDAPAGQAFLPFLVGPEQLVAASSVSQMRTQLTTIAGPAPAGFIVKMFGFASAFFIDAVSFLFIIGALIQLPDPPYVKAKKKLMWHSIQEGLEYVRRDVPLRSLMLVAMSMNFCLGGPLALGIAYLAKEKFGSPAILGTMLAFTAAGGLCGALLAGVWKIQSRGKMILLVSFVLSLLLGSLSILNGKWSAPPVLFFMGMSAGLANIHIGAWIMQRIDSSVRGRVSSVLMLGTVGIIPISLIVAGVLIAISLKLMFLLAGAMMLLVTFAAATQRTVREIQ
jgi:MFS family permease